MHRLGINSGGVFRAFGIEEGFRQIALAGFDSVDLDLTWLLPVHRSGLQAGQRIRKNDGRRAA